MCEYVTGSEHRRTCQVFLPERIIECILNSEIRQVLKGEDVMKDGLRLTPRAGEGMSGWAEERKKSKV